MEERNEKIEGDIKLRVKNPIPKWLDNFWYHYKWHTIVTLFIIFAVVLCTLQMCSKPKYDVHILYAGKERITTVREGDLSEYERTVLDLKCVCDDLNNDGEITVDFLNLFIANTEELSALEARGESIEGAEALIREDSGTLEFSIVSGDYFLLILSERLFLEYDSEFGDSLFANLSVYANDADVDYAGGSERGIYLSSLPAFAELPSIAELDTDGSVVCLRKITDVSALWNASKNEKNFEAAESVLKNMISYKND